MIDFGRCLAYFIRVWVFSSSLFFVWFHFDVKHKNQLKVRFPLGSQLIWTFICTGALLGLFFALSSEISRFFSFLPHRWGTVDEDGEFTALNRIIGTILGLGFTGFVWFVFTPYGAPRSPEAAEQIKESPFELKSRLSLRAIANIVKVAGRFKSKIEMIYGGTHANAKTVIDLALLAKKGLHGEENPSMTDLPAGTWVRIRIEGPDADAAMEEVSKAMQDRSSWPA
jgi:phosphotransferase system HPr-like phosphotransfer protein